MKNHNILIEQVKKTQKQIMKEFLNLACEQTLRNQKRVDSFWKTAKHGLLFFRISAQAI